ncbi:endonuclease [Oscillochloris sp. ZM17-4]|uniref:endonuclease n=1 Tax=Oscillochloris sp. ZM17-4 TaxID=2866714 RepID=UPI001C72F028|nr:endonuclease [Oscillochloris sp. ZM17-4]MBX0330667.1 endonuclease [Oscillochloris sp. ZM17-4]
MPPQDNQNADRYNKIILHLFRKHYVEGAVEVHFQRNEITPAAQAEGVEPPKNLGDLIYYFRFRQPLPEEITQKAPPGQQWIIRSGGPSRYKLVLITPAFDIVPNPQKLAIKIPDATPGMIARYAFSDEQALLAKLRYNRLIDIFTGLACYSLQNHLRTTVKGIGQVETDEVYVALDSRGVHYVIPVQAKGGRDSQSIVQIEHDVAMCKQKFKGLACRPIAAQFVAENHIAMFDFIEIDDQIKLVSEQHYRLVLPGEITPDELQKYLQLSRATSGR